jgi:hypothetical protein
MSNNTKSQTKRKHTKMPKKKEYEHEILKLAAEDSEDNEAIIKYFRKKKDFSGRKRENMSKLFSNNE